MNRILLFAFLFFTPSLSFADSIEGTSWHLQEKFMYDTKPWSNRVVIFDVKRTFAYLSVSSPGGYSNGRVYDEGNTYRVTDDSLVSLSFDDGDTLCSLFLDLEDSENRRRKMSGRCVEKDGVATEITGTILYPRRGKFDPRTAVPVDP